MEKILITGSNGLLGQKLVYKLIGHPSFELIASSRGENRLKVSEGYKYFSLDITDEAELKRVVSECRPDIIINTAAMTNVDDCELNQEAADLLNVRAVEYLISACKESKIFLVHLSTDFIFDGENGPYKESDIANPLSFYGMTKLKSEELIQASKIQASILRTILVYGIVDDMSRSNIVLWAKKSLESAKEINIVDDQYRMPTLAEDLADACILAAENKIKGIFHISGEDYMSIYELVEKVASFWNLDTSKMNRISSTTLDQAAKRPAKTGFNLNKSRGILAYKPHSFEEGLAILKEQIKE